MSNFVLAQRDRFEHPIFAKDKFCRGYAWDWIVANAIWKREGHKTEIKGKTVTLRRGQLSYAIRYMAKAWKWDKAAVSRFIRRLETEAMIETSTETGQLVITVCNYDKYQDQTNKTDTVIETETETKVRQQRDKSETNKNQDNQDNQDNDDSDPDEKWILHEGSDWLISRGLKETQVPRLINEWLKVYEAKQVRDAIGQAMIQMAHHPTSYIASVLKNGQRSNLQTFPHQRAQSQLDRERIKREADRKEIAKLRAQREAVRQASKEEKYAD